MAEGKETKGKQISHIAEAEQHEEESGTAREDNNSDSPSSGEEDSSSDSENDGSDDTSDDDEQDITQRADIPDSLKPQVERLKLLRARLAQSTQDNKREVYQEHQRLRENPGDLRRQERKRREAEILKEREEFQGSDYERSRFWDYSAEQVEKYEEKKRKRQENMERGFTDYSQVNQRKYERDVAKLKPDLASYQRNKAEASQQLLSEAHTPEPRNVERLVKTVEEQQKKRAALHKPTVEKEGDDVSYINERNARFNRKMNRAYDKYTKEIRDNFERGTAL
ncbi:SYF2-domain-containing protein [Martensiomyces pterosporus]|nr:SYF2-domain-containing protein [Martensiomyces pterosporus]